MNDHNTIMFLGAYWSGNEVNDVVDKNPDLFPKMPTVIETAPICRLAYHPYHIALPMTVDSGLGFPGPNNSDKSFESGDERNAYRIDLERQFEHHSELSTVDWLSKRPYKIQIVGAMDNRPAYRNRTVLAHAINNTYEVGFPDSMIEPSIIMIHHKNHDKDPEGVLADKCKADFVKLSGSNDLSKYGEGIYCSGNLQHNWKDLVPKYNHVNWDIKLFSRTVLSLRGDSLGSQRSTEGMYYGALTYHDAPLDVLSLTSIPMGNHVPWRLTGLFDEERCIENSAIALMDMYTYRKYSDPESYTYSFAHGLKLRNGTPYPSSDGEKFFEEKMMKCILKLPHLINNDHELLTLMRKAVYAYRDDVVWETPNSRLGENIRLPLVMILWHNLD
eukprot:GHVH01013867.1.p1 GENE.GHVH01013867.1~~GHVH01013867.1.p1  ORF type:complete len:400 (+),score=34.36 GHVH01013867.1:40-1200(+)